MKKNLTFLMMLMAFVGVLSAQSGPKFNYQAVVRHHVASYQTVDRHTVTNVDTLYHNQQIRVEIFIFNGEYAGNLDADNLVYAEFHSDVPTDENGFLSIVLGDEGADGSGDFNMIDWKNATLVAIHDFEIDDQTPDTVIMKVQPVPYALQAAEANLTTPLIADYMQNTLTVDGARSVLEAFENNDKGENGGLQEDVEDLIEARLKTNRAKDSIKVIAKAYLALIDVPYLQQVYNTLNNNNAFKTASKALVKAYVEEPNNTLTVARESVNDLMEWYLNEYGLMTDIKEDVKRVYHAAQEITPENKAIIKDTVRNYLSKFAKDPAFIAMVSSDLNKTRIVSDLTVIIKAITVNDANGAFGWFDLKNGEVKDQMRDDILNDYIKTYTGTASSPSTTLTDKVSTVVADEKGNLVKRCADDTSHDYCH